MQLAMQLVQTLFAFTNWAEPQPFVQPPRVLRVPFGGQVEHWVVAGPQQVAQEESQLKQF